MSSSPFSLSNDQLEELEKLAVLGYTPRKMAMYLDVDPKQFQAAAANELSEVHYRIQRGILRSEATEGMKLLDAAEKGNVTASQQLSKIRRARSWAVSRLDLFAVPDESAYEALQEFLLTGSVKDISQEEEIYLQALELIAQMSRRLGRRNTVAYFVKQGLKHHRASTMYDEAIELFFIDHHISKKAYRNLYADKVEEAARAVLQNLNSAADAETYGKLIMQAAKLRELDKEDPAKLPKESYTKPVRVLTLDPTDIGLPEINRNDLARQIDGLDIPNRDKLRIGQDALLEPLNLIEKLHGLKEESQEE